MYPAMRPIRLVLLASLLCACSGTPKSATPRHSGLDALPIAQYLGADTVTGQRVFELLRANGIESSAGGSLGYSVWVDAADRANARKILLAAAADECLPISLYDDQGHALADTRPDRCNPPATPVHSGGAK